MPRPRGRTRTLSRPTFSVVFYTLIRTGRQWRPLLEQQLGDVQASGIAAAASSFDVVLAGDSTHLFDDAVEQTLDSADQSVRSILPAADVWKYPINRFECPGIRRAWDVARGVDEGSRERHWVLYFHGKGMVNHGSERAPWNKELTDNDVVRWRQVLAALDAQPDIQKAGYAGSDAGHTWFNFWWARASYMQVLARPEVTPDRFYYERWIGRVTDGADAATRALGAANTTLTLCPANRGLSPGFRTFPGNSELIAEHCAAVTPGLW